jgi:hypothetical protein
MCGGAGQPCCANQQCGMNTLVCNNNACVQCGTPGNRCCAGNTCTQGMCNMQTHFCQ